MEDTRRLGKSTGTWWFQGGLQVSGVKFEEGTRAVGKGAGGGWYRLLVEAGCSVITQEQYEAELKKHASQSLVTFRDGRREKRMIELATTTEIFQRLDNKPKQRAVSKRRRAPASITERVLAMTGYWELTTRTSLRRAD